MDLARDKLELLRLARGLGIDAPVTHAPRSREAAAALAQRIAYPCVCKLRRGIGAQGMIWAEDAAELLRCFDAPPPASGLLFDRSRLVQAVAPGELHDVCALFNRGEPRAALTMRRIHMLPPRGGMGVYTETTDEPELREQAIALLRALDWHGPADVEFRLERPGGRAALIEINPRFWGGLELAIQAGVNFPMLAARMAVEGDVDPVFAYDVGVQQWWPFPYALRYARANGIDWRMLRQLLRVPRRLRSDLRVSDPMPLVADLAGAVRIRLKNRRGRVGPLQ
jgi:predicted ATP-grasp superfamily ATP-dependent carboligase